MSQTAQRRMTSTSVKSIMGKRVLVPTAMVGKRVKLTVQGDGNTIDVLDKEGEFVQSITEPGLVLTKRIFNLKASSQLAMGNERNRQILKDALAAEKARKHDEASELFTEYMNKTQVSVGILLPSATAGKLANNVEISGVVSRIDTDNGSLLTVDPSTISVHEPETLALSTFNLEDFTGEEEEPVAAQTATASAEA